MIQLFRINDPIRLIILFFLLLLVRLPIIIDSQSLTLPELKWMLLGEQLSNGKLLYLEVWDDTAPLMAVIYWLVVSLFGKARIVFHIISLLLIVYQAFIFNTFLIKNDIYNEKTYIPALCYGLFTCLTFDAFNLSPPLFALTFLIFALRSTLRPDKKGRGQEMFRVGLFIGIATFIYLPSIVFLPLTLLLLPLFRTSSIRYLILASYGFLFVCMLVFLYFYYFDSLNAFANNFLILRLNLFNYINYQDLLLIAAFPLAILVIAFLRVFAESSFVNFQVSCQQIMFFWLITTLVSFAFTNTLAPYQLILLAPPLSFFVAHYVLLIKKRGFAEMVFSMILIAILTINFGGFFKSRAGNPYLIDYQKMLVSVPDSFKAENKKLLVLGSNKSYYLNNESVTPYLNWQLSKRHFNQLDRYSILTKIYQNLSEEAPEVIIDQEKLIPALFEKVPLLSQNYEKRGEFYYLK